MFSSQCVELYSSGLTIAQGENDFAMAIPLQIQFQDRSIFTGLIDGAVELGRQQHHESKANLFSLMPKRGNEGHADRLVIAPLAETRIGRHQLLIELLDNDKRAKLTNLSDKVPVEVVGSGSLEPNGVRTVQIPTEVILTSKHRIQIGQSQAPKTLKSLGLVTIPPGKHLDQITTTPLSDLATEDSDTEKLIQAMLAVMDVFQSAQTEEELFRSAVRGAEKLVGIDRAVVVLHEQGKWIPRWFESSSPTQEWQISQMVLNHVLSEKQTFWDSTSATISQTLTNIDGVIAAPILNSSGEVTGALYGSCHRNVFQHGPEAITRLQARMMELLACGLASGLSRIEQTLRVTYLKLQFEQYFTKRLAEELEENPNLIDGRDAEVTVLFCDIRRFSRISERIGTEQTFKWINDVMDVLSGCVDRYDGVLIDYIGDELMAMWGAPKPQPDHANLACQAAMDMLSRLPEVDARWRSVIGESLEVGIGVNSGNVRAGNTGSFYKFKYSPLGTTVNLASRVEGATKYLRTPALMTGATAKLLDDSIPRRRLCSVRVVNIEESVPLYELGNPNGDPTMIRDYEKALQAFEDQDFRGAARILTGLLQTAPDDGPSLVLLSRTVNSLVSGPLPGHPIWTLEGK